MNFRIWTSVVLFLEWEQEKKWTKSEILTKENKNGAFLIQKSKVQNMWCQNKEFHTVNFAECMKL